MRKEEKGEGKRRREGTREWREKRKMKKEEGERNGGRR